MRLRRHTISVNGSFGRRLFDYAKAHKMSVAGIVEKALAPVLASMSARPPTRAPVAVTSVVSNDEWRDIVARARVGAGLSSMVEIPVSRSVIEDLDAQIERGATIGGAPATRAALFEAGINRMLDLLETLPPSNICGLCTGQIYGSARQQPSGRGDAVIWVCYDCDTEYPRKCGGGR